MNRTALIAGATGLVGGHCLRLLLGDPAYSRVTALVRRPLAFSHQKLTSMTVDFDRLTTADVPSCDHFFCALGTTIRRAGSQEAFRRVDLEYVERLAELAASAGARSCVLVSSVGADPGSRNFYLRIKGQAEQAVSALPFAGVHLFRPSLLLGDREETRPIERVSIVLSTLFQFAFRGPLARYHPIQAEQVARAMLGAARREGKGTHVYEYEEIVRAAQQ